MIFFLDPQGLERRLVQEGEEMDVCPICRDQYVSGDQVCNFHRLLPKSFRNNCRRCSSLAATPLSSTVPTLSAWRRRSTGGNTKTYVASSSYSSFLHRKGVCPLCMQRL